MLDEDVAELELLIRSHHPLILVDTLEEGRVHALLEHVAVRLDMPYLRWSAHRGLSRVGGGELSAIYKTEPPEQCLAHLSSANAETIAYLSDLPRYFDRSEVLARLREVHDVLSGHRGAVVMLGAPADLPQDVARLFTSLRLHPPGRDVYHRYVAAVLADVKSRMPVRVELTSEDVAELLDHLKGLPFYEVRKIVTQAIVEDGRLCRADIAAVMHSKRRAIERTGVLEYIPVNAEAAEVAGLARLRDWLEKRRRAFRDPDAARARGLTPPRGLLLTGVQGCGKSSCARAIAASWRLPLVRLDPSSLYRKYFGETEQNLRRAIHTAEAVAPVVLWIDEVEKAFSSAGDNDGGTTRRVFGSFLTWLQEKKDAVFVLATANDISGLPPELLRKGRFDEIFFLDLPSVEVREHIFALHLAKRGCAPTSFDVAQLARETEGFSGAEIEQVVVSGLYTAFAEEKELTSELLRREISETHPLSVTARERVEELRSWARGRTVSAD